jgi:hypothetical protein
MQLVRQAGSLAPYGFRVERITTTSFAVGARVQEAFAELSLFDLLEARGPAEERVRLEAIDSPVTVAVELLFQSKQRRNTSTTDDTTSVKKSILGIATERMYMAASGTTPRNTPLGRRTRWHSCNKA